MKNILDNMNLKKEITVNTSYEKQYDLEAAKVDLFAHLKENNLDINDFGIWIDFKINDLKKDNISQTFDDVRKILSELEQKMNMLVDKN